MTAPERLRREIDRQQDRIRAAVPAGRQASIRALIHTRDQLPHIPGAELPDLVTGRRVPDLGGNRALQFCLEPRDDENVMPMHLEDAPDGWAKRFLAACGRLVEAELVLGHVETGFMRLAETGDGAFHAWIATKLTPANWRERADIEWWAASLANRYEPELRAIHAGAAAGAAYRQLANLHLKRMVYQLGYPPDAVIDGCTVQTYRALLARLVAAALQEHDRGQAATPRSERALVEALAPALGVEPGVAARALAAFTLDAGNAAYHAAVPGIAPAPLVRVGPDRVVWSLYGLTTEPLFFVTRELKRRNAQDYNNSAHLREAVFRDDLYRLFADKRFVTGVGRIELRRTSGDLRTDIDAAVFDRKTGTLGIFELKSQDPFARSAAELARQRDSVLYANRQVSGMLDWVNRHGAGEILNRLDPKTAKSFRVQKVYPFVLGRYLAHFTGGPEPDRRAAWGTWPQLLRLLDGDVTGANPIASLFTRLTNDDPDLRPPADTPPHVIALGAVRLTVHASYASY